MYEFKNNSDFFKSRLLFKEERILAKFDNLLSYDVWNLFAFILNSARSHSV
jgi:hypothetical protein